MTKIPMKTECIGRFLVDLPKNVILSWTQNFDIAEVTRLISVATPKDFWSVVEARKNILESLRHESELSQLGLYKIYDSNAAVLLYWDSPVWVGGYSMDRYFWTSVSAYKMTSRPRPNSIKDEIDRYTRIFTEIVPRDDIPSQPGFCIDGAIVVGDVGSIDAGVSITIPGWRNVTLNLDSGDDNTQIAAVDPDFGPFGQLAREQMAIRETIARYPEFKDDPVYPKEFVVLRKQMRTLAGRPGEEVVWRQKQNNGAVLYKFLWFNSDPGGTPAKPGISIDMSVGNSDQPTIGPPPEQDLLSLWDAVLNSVRRRPGA